MNISKVNFSMRKLLLRGIQARRDMTGARGTELETGRLFDSF